MGVRSLSTFVRHHRSTEQKSFAHLSNKKIAVDASVFLYAWLKQAAQCKLEQSFSKTKEDKPEYHWEWHCIQSLDTLRKYKIQLIFLIERSHPDEKNATVQERQKKREQATEDSQNLMSMCIQWKDQMDTIGNSQYDVKKAKRNVWKYMKELLTVCTLNSVRANSKIYETFKRLIEYTGLRWIECGDGQEAEYVAVDMARYGMVDYVMSNDSDCIACLCQVYICDFDWDTETYRMVHIQELLKRMRLTETQFQIACCCMGNDYVDGLFRDGVYWGSITNELRRLRLTSKLSMLEMFPDVRERLEFCWSLYTRLHAVKKEQIEEWMRGDGCVNVHQIYSVRTTGVCV